MKAFALGTMLLCGALAACSSSGSDGTGTGSGSGGGDGGGDNDGGSDAGNGGSTSTPASTGTTPATTTAQQSSSTGNNTCPVGDFFDPATAAECNTCLNASCCDQAEACLADFDSGGDQCILQDGTGSFNPDGTLANALFACLDTNCPEECGAGSGGICTSGLSYGAGNEDLDACLGEACCDEYLTCTADGTDVQACVDCVNGDGGPLCDPAVACADASGCFGFTICDSIVSLEDETVAECMGTNCCDETKACFGEDQASFDACNACLTAGSGVLCDELIACDTTFTCGFLTAE